MNFQELNFKLHFQWLYSQVALGVYPWLVDGKALIIVFECSTWTGPLNVSQVSLKTCVRNCAECNGDQTWVGREELIWGLRRHKTSKNWKLQWQKLLKVYKSSCEGNNTVLLSLVFLWDWNISTMIWQYSWNLHSWHSELFPFQILCLLFVHFEF